LIGGAAAATALAVAGFTLFAWYEHATSGPGDDAELAARSLHRVLISKDNPGQRVASVHCDGLRDGSDFFGCQVSWPGLATTSYSVSYSRKSELYTAEGGAATANRTAPSTTRPGGTRLTDRHGSTPEGTAATREERHSARTSSNAASRQEGILDVVAGDAALRRGVALRVRFTASVRA
jgi:hypothetical protein